MNYLLSCLYLLAVFSVANAQLWTWLGGSSVANATGSYNMSSVESTFAAPGALELASAAVDGTRNQLYIYGGYGLSRGIAGSFGNRITLFSQVITSELRIFQYTLALWYRFRGLVMAFWHEFYQQYCPCLRNTEH